MGVLVGDVCAHVISEMSVMLPDASPTSLSAHPPWVGAGGHLDGELSPSIAGLCGKHGRCHTPKS